MKRTWIVLVMVIALVTAAGCLDEKVIEIVLTAETTADFQQDEDSANWTEVGAVNLGQEIRDILDNNGYSTADIKEAYMTAASYGVTSFNQSHDWEIGGRIDVTYGATTKTAINYASQSVQAALGRKIPVPLETDAVTLMNQALQDFLNGDNPVLTFTVVNDSVTPEPSGTDRMIFDWRAWLAIQVVVDETVNVPDPF